MRVHASLFPFPSESFSSLPCSSPPTRYYSKHTPSPSVEDLIDVGMAAGGHRRSRRMHGGSKMAEPNGADLMKVGSVIRDLVRLAGCSSKSGACGIRTHAGASATVGHVVKLGAAESAVKPSSADSEEVWIYVRGCRIERAGLRFNSQGNMYIPDSEDEEVAANGAVGMERAPAVAADGAADVDLALAVTANGAAGMDLALAVAANGAAGVDVAPTVAVAEDAGMDVAPKVAAVRASSVDVVPDGVVGVNMNSEVAGRLAKKVLGKNLHPEVAARLVMVLSEMEPFYHECFIGMYKLILVISSF